jgi:outer membrane murein-binding lipoprotein Lpp
MKNTMIKAAIVTSFLMLGGCSTYNTYAPDWAKMGGSETETETQTESANSKWWNPFSW